ncbi:MAG: hypothetical protein WC975_09940 [Phycisphaerae bacterium]
MDLILPERILRHLLEQGVFREQLHDRLVIIGWVMLGVSALIWIFLGHHRKGYEITSLYWLACCVGVWGCLYLPIWRIIPSAMLVIGIISFLFAYLPMRRHRRLWKRAWPDHLENLVKSYQPPGGLTTSVTALSLMIFFLGLCYLTSAMTARSSFIMGVALFILVRSDFRLESALAGMVLITLAIISAFLDLFKVSGQSPPTILNMAIIPMAYMSFQWIWLGRVWQGQIIDGKPLTISARMVHLTRHVGVMMLGFSTLLAVKLALWPMMPVATEPDNSTQRFILMGLAYGILLGSNIWMWLRLQRFSLGVLAALNIFGAAMAVLTRFPGFFHRVFWPYWFEVAVIYTIVAMTLLLVFRRKIEKMSNVEC